MKDGRLARRRLAVIPPGPAFRTVRAAKDDFTSPFFYAPRRLAIGFAELAKEIVDSSPQLWSGKEGRRGHAPSGAVATGHDFNRTIRKSRIAHRQFTGPSFRPLITAMGGSIFPFFRRPFAWPADSRISRMEYRIDRGPKRGSPRAVSIARDSAIAPRKSRNAPSQLTGPTFRTLIAAMGGSIPPFYSSHRMRKVARQIGPLFRD